MPHVYIVGRASEVPEGSEYSAAELTEAKEDARQMAARGLDAVVVRYDEETDAMTQVYRPAATLWKRKGRRDSAAHARLNTNPHIVGGRIIR